MNKKLFLVIAIIFISSIGVIAVLTNLPRVSNNSPGVSTSPSRVSTNLPVELTGIDEETTQQPQQPVLALDECEDKESQNLMNNEYLLAEQLSVEFYTSPSESLINELAEKYNLGIIQIYKDPNVVFKVEKENSALVKCQLQNEVEVKNIVFIESRPLPVGQPND